MSADLDTSVVDFVLRVTKAMGLDLTVNLEEADDNVRLNLSGDGADLLTKHDGEALDALQVIVNTAFRRDARGDRHYLIDAKGFRKDKDAELRDHAKELAAEVRSTGVPREIGPLNPYARRIVHLAIAEDDEMTTESIGDSFLKTIVISKKH